MNELTLDDIEKVIKEYENSHPEGKITYLGNGLYKVGFNLICGKKFIEELQNNINEEIKEVRRNYGSTSR